MSERALCPVRPENYGDAKWIVDRSHVLDVARRRRPEDPEGWADEWFLGMCDEGDLRALGFCRHCGQPITLREVGRCVYSEPCGHYRAQGELRRMQPYIDARRTKITPERRLALLALIGRDSDPTHTLEAPRG